MIFWRFAWIAMILGSLLEITGIWKGSLVDEPDWYFYATVLVGFVMLTHISVKEEKND